MRLFSCALIMTCFAAAAQAETILVEAEQFSDVGGWKVDTQFSDQMGSSFLLAHGLGTAVSNASTDVNLTAGDWRIWVRTRDWVEDANYAPGTFKVKIGTNELAVVFGDEDSPDDWGWVDGGTVAMDAGAATLTLIDQSGFDGRMDAIALIKGSTQSPPNDSTLPAWRDSVLGISGDPALYGSYDLIVLGAEVGGCCAAYAAAEKGLSVALVTDRPVLGGTASSEILIQGHNTRRNDTVDDFYNSTQNDYDYGLFKDAFRLSKIVEVGNVAILTNHLAVGVVKNASGAITALDCYDVTSGNRKRVESPLFVDATIDGKLGELAGADMMEGRELQSVFNEPSAPAVPLPAENAKNLGAALMWGEGVDTNGMTYTFPEVNWTTNLVGTKEAESADSGRSVSGIFDSFPSDAEKVRDRLLMAAYGQFSNAKASGLLTSSNYLGHCCYNLARFESRRIVGDYIMTELDALNRRCFEDAVAASSRDAVYRTFVDDDYPFISQTFTVQYYDNFYVPFRSLYSKDVPNLMMAGPAVSASHLVLAAFSDSSFGGECGVAVGKAAAICKEYGILPRDLYRSRVYTDELRDDIGELHAGRIYTQEKLPYEIGVEVIVDNSDTESVTNSGPWTYSTSSPDRYAENYRANQENAVAVNNEDTWFEFQPVIPEDGWYNFDLFYNSGASRGSAVKVVVSQGDAITTNIVDMTRPGNAFTPVSRSYFTNGVVRIRLLTIDIGQKYVIADAVRLTKYKDIIVDNADGTDFVEISGNWTVSTSEVGRFGANYLHNGRVHDSSTWVRFTPGIPQDGFYDIYCMWAGIGDRSTSARLQVNSAGGSEIRYVDMNQNNGEWNYIGRAEMHQGAGHNVRYLTEGSDYGYVIVDALRFVMVTNDVIVDDADGAPSVSVNGSNWKVSSYDSGKYGSSYYYNDRVSSPENWVQFTPDLPFDGVYQMHQIWHGSGRATNVEELVVHADGTSAVYVNMNADGDRWNEVGMFTFDAGTNGNIRVTSNGAGDNYVIADAVWFQYHEEDQPGFDWDEDGLPDSFERYYFLDETAALPGDDPDGDGLSNLEEYQQETDPTVANPPEGSVILLR